MPATTLTVLKFYSSENHFAMAFLIRTVDNFDIFDFIDTRW